MIERNTNRSNEDRKKTWWYDPRSNPIWFTVKQVSIREDKVLSKKWSRFTESDVVIAWDLLDSLYAVCTYANFGHEKMHACALITYDAVIQSRSSMLSYIQSHSAPFHASFCIFIGPRQCMLMLVRLLIDVLARSFSLRPRLGVCVTSFNAYFLE